MKLAGIKTFVKWHPDYEHNWLKGKESKMYVKRITSLEKGDHYITLVAVDNDYVECKTIRENGHGSKTGCPMLVLADVMLKIEPFSNEELKKANSRHDAINCAKCNDFLKEPFPNIKYCPVCEK